MDHDLHITIGVSLSKIDFDRKEIILVKSLSDFILQNRHMIYGVLWSFAWGTDLDRLVSLL